MHHTLSLNEPTADFVTRNSDLIKEIWDSWNGQDPHYVRARVFREGKTVYFAYFIFRRDQIREAFKFNDEEIPPGDWFGFCVASWEEDSVKEFYFKVTEGLADVTPPKPVGVVSNLEIRESTNPSDSDRPFYVRREETVLKRDLRTFEDAVAWARSWLLSGTN